MSEESANSGYKGHALEAIRKAHAKIGDIVRITKQNEVYEGILIPRSEYGDQKHVVIKMKSGYNVGVKITPTTEIEKIGEGARPAFVAPPQPKQDDKLPKVTILSTGGTIASRVDYRTGGVRPALTAGDLYSVVPELSRIARIDAQILFSLFSENIQAKHWMQTAKAVAEQVAAGVNGVVIAHGTDTMAYTAAALSFALQNLPIPVVLVGSQRSADRPSSDAATNLVGAVNVAAKAPFAEVVLVMHETPSDTTIAVHRGTKVRKCHTSRRDTFKSINASPMARVQDQEIIMQADDYKKRNAANKLVMKPEFDEKVALVKFYPNMDSEVINWYLEKSYKGLILEGTGLGHVGKNCYEPLKKAIENNIIVAMCSQCIWGRVNMNVYDTGRDLQALGVIPLEDMLSETALVKLMWIFGQTRDPEEAKKLLKTNIVGELSPRTLSDTIGNE
jgi:glutamyl-tRNA(Gln) amidotransferase subunit D